MITIKHELDMNGMDTGKLKAKYIHEETGNISPLEAATLLVETQLLLVRVLKENGIKEEELDMECSYLIDAATNIIVKANDKISQ